MLYGETEFWKKDESKSGVVHCFSEPRQEVGYFAFNETYCYFVTFEKPRVWDHIMFDNIHILNRSDVVTRVNKKAI